MKKEELREDIEVMLLDCEFSYKGVDGSICPFDRDNIAYKYGSIEGVAHSVDELMTTPFIGGETIDGICDRISFY